MRLNNIRDFSKRFIGHINSQVRCRVLYAVAVWGKYEDYPAVMYAAVLIATYTGCLLGPVCFVSNLISISDIGTFWTHCILLR